VNAPLFTHCAVLQYSEVIPAAHPVLILVNAPHSRTIMIEYSASNAPEMDRATGT